MTISGQNKREIIALETKGCVIRWPCENDSHILQVLQQVEINHVGEGQSKIEDARIVYVLYPEFRGGR